MKKLANTGNKLLPWALFIVLTSFWQLVSETDEFIGRLLPSPVDIITTFFRELPVIIPHGVVTLNEALTGFGASIVLALLLAVMMDAFEPLYKALYPLILVSQTVPLIALAPLFLLWFGFGQLPKILIVMLMCFFPVLVSLLDGFKSVDSDLLNLMRSMGAGRVAIFRIVKFPGAMMSFFSGVRIAATYSIMGAVISEWVGGSRGLGVYMIKVKNSFAYDKMFAAILLVVALSMAMFKLTDVVQNMAMPWYRLQQRNTGE